LEVDEARTTLGVDQCPSGNMDQQAEKMEDLTRTWAAQMKAGYLKRPEMWLSLTSTIWKSLEYPLNANTLSKAQCEGIMAPALTVGLNGLGICRNLPRKLVYGPVEKQGLGLPHLYSLQGIVHVEDLILHTCLESLTGEMFVANLEQRIVDVSVGAEVLQTSFQDYGFLTPYT
jgi:hypothetical protein